MSHETPADGIYFGLMSGTSMDGVDGVAVAFEAGKAPVVLAQAFADFPGALRESLFALQESGPDEIARAALAANALAQRYAACCHALLREAGLGAGTVRAIGAHGQTVRHRPEAGYTQQINNPALLAELTAIDVSAVPTLSEGDWVQIDFAMPMAATQSGMSQYELLTGLGGRFERGWL